MDGQQVALPEESTALKKPCGQTPHVPSDNTLAESQQVWSYISTVPDGQMGISLAVDGVVAVVSPCDPSSGCAWSAATTGVSGSMLYTYRAANVPNPANKSKEVSFILLCGKILVLCGIVPEFDFGYNGSFNERG